MLGLARMECITGLILSLAPIRTVFSRSIFITAVQSPIRWVILFLTARRQSSHGIAVRYLMSV